MQATFWVSTLLLFHAYIGYPLGMALWARLRPKPVRADPSLPTVTAVIVVHDGAAQIAAKLRNLFALDYPPSLLDIVVACDGCNDDSAEACRALADARIRVLEFVERRGKAACLNDAVAAASGELLLFTDVRQRVEIGALRALVANFSSDPVGAVSGELHFEDPESGFARGVDAYWRYEKMIRRAESASGSMVGVTGALYAMRRALFHPLPEGTVLDDVLNPMNVVRQGRRVVFDSSAVAWDHASASAERERLRKIRTLAGNYQLLQLAPWLADPRRNPIWYRFVCHKMLRLLAPWLIAAALLADVVLARHHLFYLVILIAFAIAASIFMAARIDARFAQWAPARLLMAFVYLNWFSAEALIAFARNRRLHLW